MKIVYFGSRLSRYRKMKSAMETMVPFFSTIAQVRSYSDKRSIVAKSLDMLRGVLLNKNWADIVIVDVFSTKAFYFSVALGFLCDAFKKPFILVLRGGNLPRRFKKKPFTVKWLFNKADAIVAPSPYLQSFFKKQGFFVNHIPNIIDLSQYEFKLRESLEPTVLYLRGFGEVYNPLMLVHAIHQIRDIPKLKVLMLGSPNEPYYNDVLAAIEKLELQSIITVENKKTRDEWVELSKDYSFMVSCPDVDNTPVSLIEGMALGMCVITTKVGGIPFMVNEQEVFFVQKDDHQQLANTIHELCSNPSDYNIKARLARAKAEEFTWTQVKPLWQKLFSSLL